MDYIPQFQRLQIWVRRGKVVRFPPFDLHRPYVQGTRQNLAIESVQSTDSEVCYIHETGQAR